MLYCSTRNASLSVPSAHAIKSGLSKEGGLFMPEAFPQFPHAALAALTDLPYAGRAETVLSAFLTDYTPTELSVCTRAAYAPGRFDGDPAPVKRVGDRFLLELWHGPTHAFKDIALQILPRLLTAAIAKEGGQNEVFILVATSGDTGKAALEGFAGVPGTKVGVFYPYGGVSRAQELQMRTQEGNNVFVCAVKGNFDDTQTGVKAIFGNEALADRLGARGVELSSANSINFGRLVPQVAYYFSAYADLVLRGTIRMGDEINFCVPTGNFGNILAGYFAREMGLPIHRLLCASNSNNVLYDFIRTGVYDANRHFHKTTSPSMDILVSSNLERLLFLLAERDDGRVRTWMQALKEKGVYDVGQAAKQEMQGIFSAGWADEAHSRAAIAECHQNHGYVLDPHTAVGWAVAEQYQRETHDARPMVLVSTASPYKFSHDVLTALQGQAPEDAFACADALFALTALPMPESLRALRDKPLRHSRVCEIAAMPQVALDWAEGRA